MREMNCHWEAGERFKQLISLDYRHDLKEKKNSPYNQIYDIFLYIPYNLPCTS